MIYEHLASSSCANSKPFAGTEQEADEMFVQQVDGERVMGRPSQAGEMNKQVGAGERKRPT